MVVVVFGPSLNKGGDEEGKRGRRCGQGLMGERGGKNEGERVGGKGPGKAGSKNSDFGVPL